jgi:3-(3-hydroxy-phenyl)propionate hydroxylase
MKYDVCIVGLGPVGATASLLLAEAGLNVVAVEKDPEIYALPRAVNLDGEIIRGFQRIGRGGAVASLMQTVRPGDRAGFANSKRQWMFGQAFVPFGSNGWQPMNMFDQPEFESYLRDQILAHPRITTLLHHEVTSIEGTIEGRDRRSVDVNAVDLDKQSAISIEASYLIGCDGASSFVRKHFNIGWQDLGYDCDWLVVDVTTKDGHTLTNDTVQVCDPARISTYVCTKDPYRRWEFKMLPGETRQQMLETEMIHSLIDHWTPRDTYEIRRAAVYQFHAATAECWRVNNVFIAGDAAHQTPPFLGQGMNAGMRDAINLSWKIPLVINGDANETLLDSYYQERNAHAYDLVQWAVSIGRLMDHLAEVERAEQTGNTPPVAPGELKSSGYGQGREQPPIRDGVICIDQVSDTGSTGYLFRQPEVKDERGASFKLDELLGASFAIVGKTRASLQISDSSRIILDAIGARCVCLDNLEVTRGHFDRLFDEHEAAIVRPDRIVFGHTTQAVSLDDLIQELATKLALTYNESQQI